MPEERLYSLDEARAMLPATVRRLEQIAELRQQMRAWGSAVEGMAPANGETPGLGELLSSMNARLRELADDGILVRDLRTGIIDFPGRDADGPLCWCYRLGEPDILYCTAPTRASRAANRSIRKDYSAEKAVYRRPDGGQQKLERISNGEAKWLQCLNAKFATMQSPISGWSNSVLETRC